jgi:hypothetical protein
MKLPMHEQSKSFLSDNWFKLSIVAIALLIISIYFYGEYQLDSCINYAEKEYARLWDEQCTARKKGSGCELSPMDISKGSNSFMDMFSGVSLNASRDKSIDECYRRYSFK